MNAKVLLILAGLAVPTIGLAWWLTSRDEAKVAAQGTQGPFFAGLRDKAETVTRVRILRGETPFVVERTGDRAGANQGWVLPARSNYPAKPDKVRTLIQSMLSAITVDERTSNPDNYKLIGVQDPGIKGDNDMYSTLVELEDASGAKIASVIVGQAKSQAGFVTDPNQQAVYVRRGGEATSWLVTGPIEVDGDELNWAEREAVNIHRDRVKSATITRSDGQAVTISRPGGGQKDFNVENIPEGRSLRYPAVGDQVAGALSFVAFDDVKPAGEIDLTQGTDPAGSGTMRVVCLDGLVIDATVAKKDGKTWVKLVPSYDAALADANSLPATPVPETTKPGEEKPKGPKTAEQAKAEAESLAAKLSPWVYQLSEYKASGLMKSMEDLLKPATQEAANQDAPPGVQPIVPPPNFPMPPAGPVGPTPEPK
jgi:hypothetical protein